MGQTTYETYDELLSDARSIRKYGDIPTIRRALKLLNEDRQLPEKIHPIMTYRIQQRIKRKDRIRVRGIVSL